AKQAGFKPIRKMARNDCSRAPLLKTADGWDLKSCDRKVVPVQVWSRAYFIDSAFKAEPSSDSTSLPLDILSQTPHPFANLSFHFSKGLCQLRIVLIFNLESLKRGLHPFEYRLPTPCHQGCCYTGLPGKSFQFLIRNF